MRLGRWSARGGGGQARSGAPRRRRRGVAPPRRSPGTLEGAWACACAVDSRGGMDDKSYLSANAKRPLWNQAKEELFQDKKVTSVTISSFSPEQYCEARKHWDYVWFEMQHATLTFAEVQKMIAACPGVKGAAPMIRMPDALERIRATDRGVMGRHADRRR